jgi:hypothetical protein
MDPYWTLRLFAVEYGCLGFLIAQERNKKTTSDLIHTTYQRNRQIKAIWTHLYRVVEVPNPLDEIR